VIRVEARRLEADQIHEELSALWEHLSRR